MRGYSAGSIFGITACIASDRPSPITCAAAASLGTDRPRSLAADCIHLTMVAVLSISVPSQSKTIRSNCFLAMFSVVHRVRFVIVRPFKGGFSQAYQETLAFRRQGRLQGHRFAGFRVQESDLPGVQEHAAQGPARLGCLLKLLVKRKI